ncbi:CPBP family intramembrane glutamic endopeptidase [uncultured Eudoraea sp.]|uniref:CPBP family intramembrane glutamic endopeptidase n=1 Tax=uncultured Eudoraea sp. TaxID=1035614 RepID=UPI00262F0F38|nr:CPBP family intramembrane glutamic endopeptidase [uncultured Eudoraea sp.]
MYIEQGYKGLHELWRYAIGVLIIIVGWQVIGAAPLTIVFLAKALQSGDIPTDLDLSGISNFLGSNLFFFLVLLTFAIGFIVLYLTVKLLHKQSFVSLTTSRKRIDWKRVFFTFFLWAVISVAFIGLDIYLSPEDYVYNFQPDLFLVLLLIAIIFIPIQTSFEEYFLRGYLMQGLGIAAKNRWVPLIGTSLIFGLMHIFNPEVAKIGYGVMVFYIGTGLFLGILTLMDEGLELALGFHAANNFTAALIVHAEWTAFQTNSIYKDISEPEIGWEVFAPVFIIYPIVLLILSKKYGWTNWKDRLTGNLIPPVSHNETTEIK